MAEYIDRLAIGKAYMDLCLAMGKQAKSRKGATFFPSDLLPETEPTTKELFGLVMAMPAADVVPVRHGRWDASGRYRFLDGSLSIRCTECGAALHPDEWKEYHWNYCPNCGAKMDEVSE